MVDRPMCMNLRFLNQLVIIAKIDKPGGRQETLMPHVARCFWDQGSLSTCTF